MMLDTAVRLSLQAASQKGGAGPSSGRLSEPSPAVRRRAVAAERRLAARHCKTSDTEGLDDLSDSSFEEPLLSKANTVVTSRATKTVARRVNDTKNMSYNDYAAAQKRKRKGFLSARRAGKEEEKALMQKLRRKLTHVGWLMRHMQL